MFESLQYEYEEDVIDQEREIIEVTEKRQVDLILASLST